MPRQAFLEISFPLRDSGSGQPFIYSETGLQNIAPEPIFPVAQRVYRQQLTPWARSLTASKFRDQRKLPRSFPQKHPIGVLTFQMWPWESQGLSSNPSSVIY